MRTEARWKDLHERIPPYQTCHRRFQQWVEIAVFERIIEALAVHLQERGIIDLSECFIGGTFGVAKKGGYLYENYQRQRTLFMAITYARGVLISVSIQSASLHELTLVEKTLKVQFIDELRQKFIGNKAYYSNRWMRVRKSRELR